MLPKEFKSSPYLNLATFRKTGAAVETPVWFASDEHYLYVFSAKNAGKIKRLRNSSRSRVAVCSYNGKILGQWHEATATILPQEETPTTHKLFVRKYGWQMRSLDILSKLGGKYPHRSYLRIELAGQP